MTDLTAVFELRNGKLISLNLRDHGILMHVTILHLNPNGFADIMI